MDIDPRLDEIDDCLYRVATKALVVQDGRILLVKEVPENWWGFPGGGVDHGEVVTESLAREVEEELGVPAVEVVVDGRIIHYTIGGVVSGVPRMNLFFKATVPIDLLKTTADVSDFAWFTKEQFLTANMSPSYADKAKLADIIFANI